VEPKSYIATQGIHYCFLLHLQAIQKVVDTNSASTLQQGKFSFFSGPKAKTVSTFWKMVWEQNSSVIVMLTNLKEKEKVQKYFPLAY
jgi:protein tyrosine phosphatase